jgi:hypothetical protein
MGYLQSVLIGFELDTFEAEKIQWLQLATGLKFEPFNELVENFESTSLSLETRLPNSRDTPQLKRHSPRRQHGPSDHPRGRPSRFRCQVRSAGR